MKISRRICATWDKNQIGTLKKHGISVSNGFECFNIEENEQYFELKPLFDKWEVFDVQFVEFSKKEILDANYCIVSGCNSGGYPMPDNDFGYIDLTYDSKRYCNTCGFDKVQKDAFRLKAVPKHKIFLLDWIYDELFVDRNVYSDIFQPLGIASREVKLYKGDKIIDSVVQLELMESEEALDLSGFKSQACPTCRKVKYEAQARGFFPIHPNPRLPIYKSKEYFGDGAAANRKIFISAELRDKLLKEKLMKHPWLIPCEQPKSR